MQHKDATEFIDKYERLCQEHRRFVDWDLSEGGMHAGKYEEDTELIEHIEQLKKHESF